MNKVEEVESSHKGGEEAKVIVVTRPRRRRIEDDPDVKEKKELLEKLEVSENLIKNLQSEVKALKDELDKVKSLNIDLESQNMKLNQNLASAEAKIADSGTSSRKVRILYIYWFVILYFASKCMECVCSNVSLKKEIIFCC
jgi:predicted RNase H-like nuclease (RuvC/YqgF family)